MNGEFVAAMEEVLDLYAEPYAPDRPVVCFDETSTVASSTRTTPTPRLRVSARWYPQHLPGLRTPGWLAPRGHHPETHHAGLRPPDAVAD